MTKKQLKKLKQKQKAAAQSKTTEESKVGVAGQKKDMSDILFRQNEGQAGEQEQFSVDSLFALPVVASSLHRLIPPSFFNTTPREIYE